METEIWKAHPEYVGIEVSTFGNVRTLDRVVSSVRRTYLKKGRFLKQSENADGYLRVSIEVGGKRIMRSAHRLVAQTFIKNTDNLQQINHKDCNPSNNCVSNLEWCTASYNQKYREKYGISNTESQGHPLFAINLSTLEVSQFRSQHEAGRELGIKQSNINSVVKGKLKQTCSFWFVNDDGHTVDIVKSKIHDIGKTGLKI